MVKFLYSYSLNEFCVRAGIDCPQLTFSFIYFTTAGVVLPTLLTLHTD